MALVGSSIGLMFALSLVGSPLLYRHIGMGGIFILTGVLALVAIWVVVSVVPEEALAKIEAEEHVEPARLGDVLRNPDLLRLNLGIFSLHVVQMAIFVVVPLALVSAGGLPVDEHWKVYLPVVLASFVLMVPAIFYAEKKDAHQAGIPRQHRADGGGADWASCSHCRISPRLSSCCWASSLLSTYSRRACRRWCRARRRRAPRARPWACTTRPSRWACSSAARRAAG